MSFGLLSVTLIVLIQNVADSVYQKFSFFFFLFNTCAKYMSIDIVSSSNQKLYNYN